MKKQFIFYSPLWIPAILVITFFACKKSDPEPYTGPLPIDYTVLPPATQTGAGTFGCLVDGEVWVPRVPLLTVTYRDIEAYASEKNGSGAASIICNLVDIEKQQDNFLQIVSGITLFQTSEFCYPNTTGVSAQFKKTNGEWYLSTYFDMDENCVTITRFDTLNNIISGTFNFTVYHDTINKNEKVVISDGRFDLKYGQQ